MRWLLNPLSPSFQFVADGVFKAELNEFFTRELAEDGYSGVEVRVTPTRTEIIILATRTQNVLGEKGRRIRELTSVVQKRFNFPEGTIEVGSARRNALFAEICSVYPRHSENGFLLNPCRGKHREFCCSSCKFPDSKGKGYCNICRENIQFFSRSWIGLLCVCNGHKLCKLAQGKLAVGQRKHREFENII